MSTTAQPETPSAVPTGIPSKKGTGRLESLDVFRGITIAGMTIVNNPGTWSAVYAPLLHAQWHGWTHTDLVFPFFLFIMGVSIAFSMDRRRERGDTRLALFKHIVLRALVIFAVGVFLNLYPTFDFPTVRIPGVLQRIAVVYLIAGAIVLVAGRRGRITATLALLFGYWAVMTLVPVPGIGPANLEKETNLAAYVDRALLSGHMGSTTRTWDPQGVLSTLPAIASCLLGVLTGEMLRGRRDPKTKAARMLVLGAIGLLLGWLWGLWFPINKNLWTSSYVVFTAGYALVALAACYWRIDIKGIRSWGRPFLWLGMNPLFIYAAQEFVAKTMSIVHVGGTSLKARIYHDLFEPLARPKNASLLFALAFLTCWILVARVMYKKRIFVKL